MAADNASQTSLPSNSSHRPLVSHTHSDSITPTLTPSHSQSPLLSPTIPMPMPMPISINTARGGSGSNRNSFMSQNGLTLPSAPPSPGPGSRPLSAAPSTVSLTAHYLPNKFSSSMLAPANVRRRKPRAEVKIPKMGGGVEAFKAGESRMPGEADEDYDGWEGGKGTSAVNGKRWNKFKWALFVANSCLSAYALTTLILLLLIHFNIFEGADIIRVGNHLELVLSTIACAMALLTSTIGWAGILLNNRAFLAVYTFLLWVVFGLVAAPGYVTYKKRTFNLEGKINAQWSRDLGASGRLRIQDQLFCCGYFSPYVEATVSQTCYARSVLPGCKSPYLQFERNLLMKWYTWSFALVAAQAAVMITALLSANHVTYRFGKGMMPKAYRLSMSSMAVIMDNYATQLAESYGLDVGVSNAVVRNASGLNVGLPTLGYKSEGSGGSGEEDEGKGKGGYGYESVAGGGRESVSPVEK